MAAFLSPMTTFVAAVSASYLAVPIIREVFPNIAVYAIVLVVLAIPATALAGYIFFHQKSALWAQEQRNQIVNNDFWRVMFQYFMLDAKERSGAAVQKDEWGVVYQKMSELMEMDP